jgi:isoleucyl-tRNA synthetase
MAPEKRSDWDTLLGIRPEVLNALEDARQKKTIGSGLDAQVTITAPEPLYSVLKRNENELRALFIVSNVELSAEKQPDAPVKVVVTEAPGQKCERCWNYSTHVGEDEQYPTVCERCSAELKEIERERGEAEAAS